MDETKHAPLEIEVDDLPDIASADPVPATRETGNRSVVARTTEGRGSRLLGWAGRLLLAVLALAFGVWAWDFTVGLLARSPLLGGLAAGLIGVLVVLLLALTLREVAAIARLSRIDTLRSDAIAARESGDVGAARLVVAQLTRLHRGRGDVAWGAGRMAELSADLVEGGDVLNLAEREMLRPLDARALAEVEAAAARVATVTALVPVALADVAVALYSNIAMIRRIAEIYGGRSGTIGAWRLTRAVVAHLAATGVVAAGDDLIGSAMGGGVLSKLSRRFGEGLINGALTARVGITAMELCRPLPFDAERKPRVAATVRRALAGLFTRDKE